MKKIIVVGGKRLSGEVEIGGSKNAALPILFGGIVTGGVCVFSNLPRVSDVLQTLEILKYLGARICFLTDGEVRVDYSHMRADSVPDELTAPIRGSTYLLGAMLARFGRAELGCSGGCDFGSRPIDQHLMGFDCLGATVTCHEQGVSLSAPKGLLGAHIRLAMPSVGATANLMLAACRAKGETVIENAAAEPHVAALAAFLQSAGALISGVGTDTVRIEGGHPLHGTHNRIISDMIEAGTYLCLGAACGGPVRVRNVCPQHLCALTDALREMGVRVERGKDSLTATARPPYRCIDVTTGPYPAFPTDLHPQMTALMSIGERAVGQGSVTEMVFHSRFRYLEELRRMGAHVLLEERRATVTPAPLHAARVHSPDLRGGAALLIAALATKGQTEILDAHTVGRGYEHLEGKLRALGARIRVL